ncbi:MAG: cyclic pyranopterin monophosphate synthase MoaC [bacterium]|nr:cyclic pyranopterin monophosphate synthase MoaC [bacterium]
MARTVPRQGARGPARRHLTHIDGAGRARMVDVSRKPETLRRAVARGRVTLRPRTLELIARRAIAKGDVFSAARIAGIMAAKGVGTTIPLCHPLCLAHAEVDFIPRPAGRRARIDIEASASVVGRTGVEMEALAAVAAAALTIYDMCKAVDDSMRITGIRLVRKTSAAAGEASGA